MISSLIWQKKLTSKYRNHRNLQSNSEFNTTYKNQTIKKIKEKFLRAAKGVPIQLRANFLAETLQSRREWDDIVEVLKEEKAYQPRLFYPENLSFKNKEEIKTFPDKPCYGS